ncbi:MAG: hypothetical protein KBS75_09350 [Bacteroidales bacterium]|nr:hypothetical protein [Candidatus Equimonas faecalis]
MLRRKRQPPVDYSKANQLVSIYHNANGTFSKTSLLAFFDFRKNQNINKTGSTETNGFLLVIPAMNVGDVIPPVHVGDKVVLGQGPTITSAADWAAFIPSKVENMAVVRYVDPKYWEGAVAHWEAGG